MRRFASAVAILVVLAGFVIAAEYKGTLTGIDTDKKTVKVKIGDDEKTMKYDDKTEFVKGKDKTTVAVEDVAKRVAKKAPSVEITTTGEGDKEVIKTVTLKGKNK